MEDRDAVCSVSQKVVDLLLIDWSSVVHPAMSSLQIKAKVKPNQGGRDMQGDQPYQGVQIHVWAIACFASQCSVSEESLRFVCFVQWLLSFISYLCLNLPRAGAGA